MRCPRCCTRNRVDDAPGAERTPRWPHSLSDGYTERPPLRRGRCSDTLPHCTGFSSPALVAGLARAPSAGPMHLREPRTSSAAPGDRLPLSRRRAECPDMELVPRPATMRSNADSKARSGSSLAYPSRPASPIFDDLRRWSTPRSVSASICSGKSRRDGVTSRVRRIMKQDDSRTPAVARAQRASRTSNTGTLLVSPHRCPPSSVISAPGSYTPFGLRGAPPEGIGITAMTLRPSSEAGRHPGTMPES